METKRFALRHFDNNRLTAKDDVDNVGAGRAAKGANPFVRTSKIDKFRQEFVDFFLSIQIAYPTQKVGGNLLTKKKYAL